MHNHDAIEQIEREVKQAIANRQPLNIRAGGSKDFIGTIATDAQTLDVSSHQGIVSYEPTELVLRARSGTPLIDIEKTLTEHGQKLAFEPPQFTAAATIGGTVAAGVSGPGRPYLGAVRDHVLGCRIINGHGHTLRFGGEVMKNVAGYDVTRLMTGAMGTLGVLLDISLKVVPLPELEITLQQDSDDLAAALIRMQQLAGESPLVTASAWHDKQLYIRLSGVANAVNAAARQFGGETIDSSLWTALRDHQHPFFDNAMPLWRISVPPLTPELDLDGQCLYDWAGTQRWLYAAKDAKTIRDAATRINGHAQLFRAAGSMPEAGSFHPQSDTVMTLHANIKKEFDPYGLFNPGRLYKHI